MRDQADGEPQRVAGAARSSFAKVTADGEADGDFVLEVVLQGGIRAIHRVGVGELAAGGFEKLPARREVKNWPGKVVGVCDYKARERTGLESWDW